MYIHMYYIYICIYIYIYVYIYIYTCIYVQRCIQISVCVEDLQSIVVDTGLFASCVGLFCGYLLVRRTCRALWLIQASLPHVSGSFADISLFGGYVGVFRRCTRLFRGYIRHFCRQICFLYTCILQMYASFTDLEGVLADPLGSCADV